MRNLACALALLAACSSEPVPPAPAAPSSVGAASPASGPAPVVADPSLSAVAARLLDDEATAEDRRLAASEAKATVALLLANAAAGGPAARGRAPDAILALGDAALPALAAALTHEDVTTRRLAAVTLLQWARTVSAKDAAPAVVAALAAARGDADASVRAAAEHAWRRATGDTSTLDASRAAHEAAERASR